MPPVHAITFDVGGTLIRPWPSVGHVYAEVAARHGIKPEAAEILNLRFATAWKKLRDFRHTREEWAALVAETFALDAGGVEAFFPELYERFGQPAAWRVFDDVLPALNHLAAHGVNLAAISNWDERLRPLLDGFGLRRYFEAVIVSCEAGFTKPSPVMFELAARKLGLAPEFILHVGDSLEHDVRGAQSAGFQTVLIDRSDAKSGEGRIKSLLELEKLVQSTQPHAR
jgi:REG-2-like HAD superfamily hydrolase